MNVGVLGTGPVGRALAVTLANSGHHVAIGSRCAKRAKMTAREIGVETRYQQLIGMTYDGAVRRSRVIVLALPYDAVLGCLATSRTKDKVLVDVTNPTAGNYSTLSVGCTTSAAEEIQRALPEAHVVKAFNTVFAEIYTDSVCFGGTKVPTFVAGNDLTTRASVCKLAESAGFEACDVGDLKTARLLEPLGALNLKLGYGLGWGTKISPTWMRELECEPSSGLRGLH